MMSDERSTQRLRRALASAHIPVLLAVLLHASGDPRWRDEAFRPTRTRGLEDHQDGGLSPEIQEEIREGALELLRCGAMGGKTTQQPSVEDLVGIASFAFGEPIPLEYGELLADILSAPINEGRASGLAAVTPNVETDMRVVIIGAGISGMLASIRLQAMGIEHTIFEKEPEVGGAWQANSYPGCGVDTPSYLYSYSFTQYDWTRHYGKRDEIHSYLVQVAKANNVHAFTRFSTEVTALAWDAMSSTWHLRLSTPDGQEEMTADVVIVGVGQLSRPKIPILAGLESFGGPAFHSAQWPADLDVTGKRVALVGAGASAQQIGPAIVDQVDSLTVFQRSPQWIAPCPIYRSAFDAEEHHLMAAVPLYLKWYRARLAWVYNDRIHPSLQVDPGWPEQRASINAINHGHRQYYIRYIEDQLDGHPDLIAKSVPDYPPFGKRMLLDNGWYAMLRRDNVQLVTEAVSAVKPQGVVDTAGHEHEVDVIVFATGFHADRFLFPMRVIGRDGRTSTETWGDQDSQAYLGISSPNFPNMFFLGGPNTLLGHGGSYVTIAEIQMDYVVRLLTTMVSEGIASVECRAEVCRDYVCAVDDAHSKMVWTHPAMTNWYRNDAGRVTAVLPWRIVDYRNMVRRARIDDYKITRRV